MNKHILICTNHRLTDRSPSCGHAGAGDILSELQRLLHERRLDIALVSSPCLGRCAEGPNLRLAPGGEYFSALSEKDLSRVLAGIETFLRQGD